jgi:hypothetical protein
MTRSCGRSTLQEVLSLIPPTRESAPSGGVLAPSSPAASTRLRASTPPPRTIDPILSDGRVVPLLPLIAAVWESDQPPELEEVRLEIIRATGNDLVTRVVLERWLNPTRPPSARELTVLHTHITFHLGEMAEGRPTAWSAPSPQHSHHEHRASADAEEGTYFG